MTPAETIHKNPEATTATGNTRSPLTPTPVKQRIQSLDLTRGIAILGILIVNIGLFAYDYDTMLYYEIGFNLRVKHPDYVFLELSVISIWLVIIVFSYLWLEKLRFQFGPFEWLWRKLYYWKI